jgi:hypothetical protein
MAKHLHHNIANKLLYIDNYRDIPTLVSIKVYDMFDSIDFVFCHPAEKGDKKKWMDEYFPRLCEAVSKRLEEEYAKIQ